ncbi:hypothetical protein [Rubritalea profundi]|uniref:Xylose isomerase-like TIM barrel domain-containing protein n=1 Tax=Rubritalea profundi TaxID=1658618 RepID=A0A2S7U2Z7_9BACT|nr:hypothetical protein [Rubritalea profundi]PQJ29358.1 hypothetical protein BSZ32_13260 [Rubritalea profundi]
MDKTIKLRADIEIGVCPTHVKFVGGLVPGDDGKLPRDENGELFAVAEMRRLIKRSAVKIDSVQISQFNGADADDLAEMYEQLQGFGLIVKIILMVGGANPMDPADEDAVVAQLVEGVNTAKKFGVTEVGSTSLEEWLSGAPRKEGADFDAAVEQIIKVHKRVYDEAGIENSDLTVWQFEFLRGTEFTTFTDLGRVWKVAKGLNAILEKKFFKLLVDAAHCGDSALSIPENEALIEQIAESGELGMFHASALTTRGCLSTDDGWIGALLTACAKTGKLTEVIVELFHHEDEALAALREAVSGHGTDTLDGRSYTDAVVDGLENVSRRINNLVARGILPEKK